MKKTVQLLLALTMAMALIFSGCGKQDNADTTSSDLSSADQESTASTTSNETSTETSNETSTESADEVRSAALGTYENGIYENTYVGFGCKLDEIWQVATAEQLQEIPDAVGDILKDTEISDAVSSMNKIMDVQGTNPETGNSFSVMYMELNATQQLAFDIVSEENIVDINLSKKEVIIESFAQIGVTINTIEKYHTTFLGEERIGVHLTTSVNGQDIHIIELFDFSLGGKYGVTTTFIGSSLESIQEMMDMFYKIS